MSPHDPDALADVESQLTALEEAPVTAHPDALEAVHRTIVSELEALARVGAHEPVDEPDPAAGS